MNNNFDIYVENSLKNDIYSSLNPRDLILDEIIRNIPRIGAIIVSDNDSITITKNNIEVSIIISDCIIIGHNQDVYNVEFSDPQFKNVYKIINKIFK